MNPLQGATSPPLELAAPLIVAVALYYFSSFFKEATEILTKIEFWEADQLEDLIEEVKGLIENDLERALNLDPAASFLGEDFPTRRRAAEAKKSVGKIWTLARKAGKLRVAFSDLRKWEEVGRAFCFFGSAANALLIVAIIVLILSQSYYSSWVSFAVAVMLSITVIIPIVGMAVAFIKRNLIRRQCRRLLASLGAPYHEDS